MLGEGAVSPCRAVSLGGRTVCLAHLQEFAYEADCRWITKNGHRICISPGHGNHASALGTVDPVSGKPILQVSNDKAVLLDRAHKAEPVLAGLLKELTRESGGQVVGVRSKADGPRLERKLANRPAAAVSDYLGGRVAFQSPEELEKFKALLSPPKYQVIADENFLNAPKIGYRAEHLQVLLPGGISAEIQLVPAPIATVQDKAHAAYEVLGEKTASEADVRAAIARSEQIFNESWQADPAWSKRTLREAQEATPSRFNVSGPAGGATNTSRSTRESVGSGPQPSGPHTSMTASPSRATTRATVPSRMLGGHMTLPGMGTPHTPSIAGALAEALHPGEVCRWVTIGGRAVCIQGPAREAARAQDVEITPDNIQQFAGSLRLTAADVPDTWTIFDRAQFDALGDRGMLLPLAKVASTKDELTDPKFLAGQKPDPRATVLARFADAAAGTLAKRAPITVEPRDGRYYVKDGNATVQVLMLAGRRLVPAQILQPGTQQEAADDCHWVTIGGRRICITGGHSHPGRASAPPSPRPGAHESTLVDRLKTPDGGFTYNATDNSEPSRGFAVSPYPDRSKVFAAASLSEDDLTGYIVKNWDLLQQPGHHLGAWHDPKTGKIFLDISVVKNSAKAAKALALKRDQIAYFDLGKGVSVDVNRQAKSGQAP